MGFQRTEVEFPCGYKYKCLMDFGIFDNFKLEMSGLPICPLHGKNCPKKKA